MGTAAAIIASVVTIASVVGVFVVFVWAAKKDGEEDRAVQKRLGIKRKTRLGR